MIIYVDTSAAMKLLVEEKESAELAEQLERFRARGDTLAASLLLHTELHCAANRRPEYIAHDSVTAVLSAISLVDFESSDLIMAPLLPGRLRSADAIHLATALRLNARAIVVYDHELIAAAKTAGIDPLSPAVA
ncbi:MAG: type II toxin-antitoxin system VapC family toxin [Trebonia sp.]